MDVYLVLRISQLYIVCFWSNNHLCTLNIIILLHNIYACDASMPDYGRPCTTSAPLEWILFLVPIKQKTKFIRCGFLSGVSQQEKNPFVSFESQTIMNQNDHTKSLQCGFFPYLFSERNEFVTNSWNRWAWGINELLEQGHSICSNFKFQRNDEKKIYKTKQNIG